MVVSSINSNFNVDTQLGFLRDQMTDLQRQLATGRKSETHGGLGANRLNVLALRERSSTQSAFLQTIEQVNLRLSTVHQHLDRILDIASETRTDAIGSQFELLTNDQTELQVGAGERLNELAALLNFELGGRHYFSGRSTEVAPVADVDLFIHGDGTRAGLKQVILERNQADLGADGRGRLVIPPAALGVSSISEDVAGSPFGFKLSGVVNNLTGTVATGPAGAPPAVDVTFSATLPAENETLRLLVDLPDGTQDTIVLTAVAGTPATPEEFTIGVDADTTAANFQLALVASIEARAQTQLSAASSIAATDDFFEYDDANPPQRVAGPPFDTATALTAATTTDTVFWYQGDAGTDSARGTAIAKVDTSLTVSYGLRANEESLGTVVASLAVLVAESFSATDPNAQERYNELTSRVGDKLSYGNGGQSVLDLIGELGFKQASIDGARDRHRISQNATETLLGDFEGVDNFEVSSKLLSLQTQLEVSFEATALISRLSLVNFL